MTYAALPPPRRRSLLARVEERFLVPAFASRQADAWIATHDALAFPFQLEGELRRSIVPVDGVDLHIVEIGRGKHTGPLCTRLLGVRPQGREQGSVSLVNPALLEDLGADLTMAEIHRWMAPRFRRAGWIVVPDDVRWHGEVSRLPPPRPSRSLKSDLNKVRKFGYTLEQGETDVDWEEFYDRMVLPQARARFGGGAWIPSERMRSELAERGVLHFVRRDGIRVAGICSILTDRSLWLPLMGIKRGDPLLLREGAYSAAFALLFEWARAQGCTHVDAGRTSAFVFDGVQRFKRKWGLEPVADPLTHVTAVRVGPAAAAAFARRPVLVETGNGLATYPAGG